jgi:hypothetical protein
MNEAARKEFACSPGSGVLDEIDLALLDRDDEDQRRILIEAEHPGLKEALDKGIDEVHRGTEAMSPGLHMAMHEIVTNQLRADNPPEMWETAQRLTASGYARHEVLHMLGSVSSAPGRAPRRSYAGSSSPGGLLPGAALRRNFHSPGAS